ncbi:MAG: DUF4918 domain-containing protein [Bacteroidetes bacterium]|nr:MAG: DUF4918 domain-containing protein [Bacteroidota bacterium]
MKVHSSQADAILYFYKNLRSPRGIPDDVSVMNPFNDAKIWKICEQFYRNFYNDEFPRIFLFGINPGRFGGGITGIPFTDPIRLEKNCGIKNDLTRRQELSSLFIYEMIEEFGGVNAFYGRFLFTALSPLGFVRDGKNLNYYDDKSLLRACEPYILSTIKIQLKEIKTGINAICLGEGQNFSIFTQLNRKHKLFESIEALPHPRWIMQYRGKKIKEYIQKYVEVLNAISPRPAGAQ